MLRVFKKNELNGKWEQLSISDIEIDLDGISLLDLYKTLTPRERQDFVYAMDYDEIKELCSLITHFHPSPSTKASSTF